MAQRWLTINIAKRPRLFAGGEKVHPAFLIFEQTLDVFAVGYNEQGRHHDRKYR